MGDGMEDPRFEKIRSLIIRNDLVTAEKMLRKFDASLTKSQKDELQKKIIEQQVIKQKYMFQTPKFSKSSAYWYNILSIRKLLVYSWAILGFILYPYFKMEYFTLLSNWDGPAFQVNLIMEIIFLVYILLATLYFGFKVVENHQCRNIQREGMDRSKDTDKSSFDSFYILEKIYTKREKGWFVALLISLVFLLIHLTYMVKIFYS